MTVHPVKEHVAVTVFDITDPTCAGDGAELIAMDAVQLQSAPFHARRIIVSTEAAKVLFHSTNHRVRTHTNARDGQIAYIVFGPRAEGTVNGIQVCPGLMLMISPDVEVNVVVIADWETVTFLFPPDFLVDHLAARRRDGEYHPPQGVEMLQVSTSSAQKLFEWGKQLAETAAEQASTFNEYKDGLLAIQCELVENLLATLGTATSFRPSRSDRTRQRHSVVVKVAEDYALAQNGSHLYVSDLCRVTGVSERTLEYAFKDVMGLTPVAFLSRLRLHRVRHQLLSATPGSTTVAHEALRWGFWHFGEFSHAYNSCFGELPSDTLLRKRPQEAYGSRRDK